VAEYRDSFEGMTAVAVPITELIDTQASLISDLIGGMPDRHREFLIGFERGEPDWSRLKLVNIADLPAVRWRQLNLRNASPERRIQLVALLEASLRRRN